MLINFRFVKKCTYFKKTTEIREYIAIKPVETKRINQLRERSNQSRK